MVAGWHRSGDLIGTAKAMKINYAWEEEDAGDEGDFACGEIETKEHIFVRRLNMISHDNQ